MKIVLLTNLLIAGTRFSAGAEVEVDDDAALHLMKENLAVVGEQNDPPSVKVPDAAFAAIPEVEEEPEEEVKPTRRRMKKETP